VHATVSSRGASKQPFAKRLGQPRVNPCAAKAQMQAVRGMALGCGHTRPQVARLVFTSGATVPNSLTRPHTPSSSNMTCTFWRVANDARNGGAGLPGYAACWLRQARSAWPVKTCASNNADTDRSRYIDGFA